MCAFKSKLHAMEKNIAIKKETDDIFYQNTLNVGIICIKILIVFRKTKPQHTLLQLDPIWNLDFF